MAARPCPISLCDCPQADSPITNISAEAPDPLLFWGQIWNPYDPFSPPRLGDGLDIKVDCGPVNDLIALYNPVVYAGTQLLANLEALAASLGCPWPPSGDETFANAEQTQTVYCPDGSAFSYTVDAGTLVSPPMDPVLGEAWLAWANAWAAAYAYQQASALMDCVTRTEQPEEDAPGDDPPTGGGGVPLMAVDPYWMCFSDTLVPAYNTYTIGGISGQAYTFSITEGSIPPGTTFTQTGPRTAVLTGTPTSAGFFWWRIRAVSTTFPTTTVEVVDNLFVFGITNKSILPDGEMGTAYSEVLTAAGGTAPYTFALDAGSTLPDTFILDSDGTLHSPGPTSDGDFVFDVVVTDANGGSCVQTVLLVIELSPCPDWENDLVWPVAGGGTTGAGTRSFTPSGVTGGAQFVASVSAPTIPPDSATAFNFGGGIWGRIPSYNGPACNCNLHLIFAKVGAITGSINIVEEKTSTAVLFVPFNTTASGTYDFPFSVPDAAGTPYNIRVEITLQATGGPGPESINVDGTFSNV